MAFPKSRILSASKFIQVFKESAENKQRFCFILGSGASVDSGIPTGNELEMQWMDELMYKDPSKAKKRGDPTPEVLDEETEKLRKDIRELAEKLYDDDEMTHRFSEIEKAWEDARKEKDGYLSSEYYFDLYKLRFHPNPQNGYRFLEELMQDKEPSLGYRVLSLHLTKARREKTAKSDKEEGGKEKEYTLEDSNQHNLVITTNFDSLTEDALFLYSDKKPLVISHESLAAYIDSDTQRPIIAKVHRGLMFDPFNSPETTDHLEKEWHEALDYAFKTYTPVVIGYGGGDGSLMTYLQQSTSNKGIYWCYLDKYGLPNSVIQKFVRRRNGCLVSIDGFDKFMLELGLTMFPNEIMPPSTSKYLKAQMDTRVQNYTEQYITLRKKDETKDILSKIAKAEEKFDEALDKETGLSFWDYSFRATRKYFDKDFRSSIQDCNKALNLNPNHSHSYNVRANDYLELKEFDKAIADCKKALEINRNKPEYHHTLASIYYNSKQYQDAISAFTTAIDLFIANNRNKHHLITTYKDRAKAYRAIGETALAEADEAKAAELEAAEKGNS